MSSEVSPQTAEHAMGGGPGARLARPLLVWPRETRGVDVLKDHSTVART
jgi:hypothetical protein